MCDKFIDDRTDRSCRNYTEELVLCTDVRQVSKGLGRSEVEVFALPAASMPDF